MRKIKNYVHALLGLIACIQYGFPSRGMKVIGVTGTDGKTTTAHMIYSILKEKDINVAMISTLGAIIDEKKYENGLHVTTPSAFTLQQYIHHAKKHHATHLVLEITSHGLDQHRDIGIHYAIGVLTNVTHEHLDYHKTYENYLATKVRLLEKSEIVIVNKDDMSYKKVIEHIKNKKIVTYGKHDADITLTNFAVQKYFAEDFNILNALAACAVGQSLSIEESTIMQGLKKFQTPIGRQEIVYRGKFTVMVDFAHTPNAFQMLLSELAKKKKERLIHVFGTAGERDHSKRSEMGGFSSKYTDVIILTSEDPRNERLLDIYRDIESGFVKKFNPVNDLKEAEKEKNIYTVIDNRKGAIEKAIEIAQKDDFIVITGKAHEKSMNIGGIEYPWDEFKAVHDALQKYHYEK